jgi:hypothetical protein
MRKTLIVAALVATVVGSVAAATTFAVGGEPPTAASLSRVSSAGPTINLPAGDPRTTHLVDGGLVAVEQLAVHNGRAFYRLSMKSGDTCFGSGSPAATWPIDAFKCSIAAPVFPSPNRPILDMSHVELRAGDPQPHFTKLEGIAADGVTAIELRDESGQALARLPVVDNVYWDVNPPASAVSGVALDAAGHALADLP